MVEIKKRCTDSLPVDLALGRRMIVQPTVTLTGCARHEEAASYLFQRVKACEHCEFVDIGDLCQPLWTFPVLENVAVATAFFGSESSLWDAKQWLVCHKLY